MKKSAGIIPRIITNQIILQTKGGSIEISADPQGRMRVGGYSQNKQDHLIIDPIQKRITAASLVVGTISAQQYEGLSASISNEAIDSLDSKLSTEVSSRFSTGLSLDGRITATDLDLGSKLSTEVSSRFSTGLSLDGRISTTGFSLDSRISLETVNRFSTETSLTGRISLETVNRFSTETSLTGRISLETSNRFSSETSLTGRISLETSIRSVSETSLTGRISLETATRSSAGLSLDSRISLETVNRFSSETSLTGRISTTDLSLGNRISLETATRSSAGLSLDSRISLETVNRFSSETSLTGRISLETSTRSSAGLSLDSRISLETATRSSAGLSLDSRISLETSNRFSSETSLTGRISTTDLSLGNRISLETSNRFSSETSLTGRISLETATRSSAGLSLDSRISLETVNRFSSETSLTGRISTNENIANSANSLSSGIEGRFTGGLLNIANAAQGLRNSSIALTQDPNGTITLTPGLDITPIAINPLSTTTFTNVQTTANTANSTANTIEGRFTGGLLNAGNAAAELRNTNLSFTQGTDGTITLARGGGLGSITTNPLSTTTFTNVQTTANTANSTANTIEGRFTGGLLNAGNAAAELRNTNLSFTQGTDGTITLARGGGLGSITTNPLSTTTFTNVQTTANTANSTANTANSTANTVNGRFEVNGTLKSVNLTDNVNTFRFTSSNKFKIGIGQARTSTNSSGGTVQYDSDTDIEIVTGSVGTPDFGLLKAQALGNLILGQINFKGWNGSQFTNLLNITVNGNNYSERATIQCRSTGLGGGELEFHTAQESAYNSFSGTPTAPTRRMLITDDGFVAIGTNIPAHRLDINADLASDRYACRFRNFNALGDGIIVGSGADGTTTLIQFRNSSNTIVASITQNAGAVSYGAFTGEHPGFIVELDKDYIYGSVVKIDSINNVGRNIFYTVSKTSSSYDKKVMGIFAGIESLNLESDSDFSGSYSIYSLGDGHVMVCNEGGDIQTGDYLCSSNTPGVAMKQNDDLLHSYTVAKATQNISWNEQITGSVLISCTYHSA